MKKKLKNFILMIILSSIATILMYTSGYTALGLTNATGISDASSWLSFIGSILGSVLGVSGTYLLVVLEEDKKNKENENQVNSIISLFLKTEIEHNNNILKYNHLDNLIKTALKSNRTSVSFGIGLDSKLRMEEFEKVKYELIKHKSETIKKVIEYYCLISKISLKSNTEVLSLSEMRKLIDTGKELSDFT